MLNVGQKIKDLRKAEGISQAKLAERIGVSAGNVGEWELGRTKPGAEALVSLSKYFRVPVDWILSDDEQEAPAPAPSGLPQQGGVISPDEMELLAKWRQLTERQKGQIEGRIEEMLASPASFEKTSSSSNNGNGREEAATKQNAG